MKLSKPLPHTVAALAEYAASDPRRKAQLDNVKTNDDVENWERAENAARWKVQDAFYVDCVEQGIPNSLDHCRLAPLSQLREWAGVPA